jgi:PAT family beta-lactamase induction signal transducer AmpG
MSSPATRAAPPARFDLVALHRLAVVTVLGFASGLPLALTGQAMQAWLSTSGVDIATIGFLSIVGLPYTFKFLWAPLMDRFELPWLGRRRGWLVLTQLALAGALLWMAATAPTGATRVFALLAVLVAFVSASQDVVIDAYRTDLLHATERGLGSSLFVMGYRMAMILSGGVAFIWSTRRKAAAGPGPRSTASWPADGRRGVSVASRCRAARAPAPTACAHGLSGFLAVVARSRSACRAERPLRRDRGPLLAPALGGADCPACSQVDRPARCCSASRSRCRWPPGRRAGRALRHAAGGLRSSYFAPAGRRRFLAFIVLYKLGDAFAGSLMTPFLLQAMSFSTAEVAWSTRSSACG